MSGEWRVASGECFEAPLADPQTRNFFKSPSLWVNTLVRPGLRVQGKGWQRVGKLKPHI